MFQCSFTLISTFTHARLFLSFFHTRSLLWCSLNIYRTINIYMCIYIYLFIVLAKSLGVSHLAPRCSRYTLLGKVKMLARLPLRSSSPRPHPLLFPPGLREPDRKTLYIDTRWFDERRFSGRRSVKMYGRCFPDKERDTRRPRFIILYIVTKLKIRENRAKNWRATCVAPDTLILVYGNSARRDNPGSEKRSGTPGARQCSPTMVDRSPWTLGSPELRRPVSSCCFCTRRIYSAASICRYRTLRARSAWRCFIIQAFL